MPMWDEDMLRILDASWADGQVKQEEKKKQPNITIIKCENCKYDKCEFYNKSGNSWCPRCKGLNYHK